MTLWVRIDRIPLCAMSVVSPRATGSLRRTKGCSGPMANSCTAATNCNLFDHLVGGRKQRLRHVQTKCLCDRKVDTKLEIRRLLNREIGRFGTLQNLVDVNVRVPAHLDLVRADAHQCAGVEGLF